MTRLDDAGLADLLGAARGGSDAPPLDPALEPALEVLRTASVRLDVLVAGRSLLEHRVWSAPDLAVAVLGVQPGVHQVLVLPPSHVAAALVRITRLRPRRTGERQPRPLPRGGVGALLEPDPATRSAALEEVGASWAWQLAASAQEGRSEVTGVDGADGLFLADPGADVLVPFSNTSAYRVFATALRAAAPAPVADQPSRRHTSVEGSAPRASSVPAHVPASSAAPETGSSRQ